MYFTSGKVAYWKCSCRASLDLTGIRTVAPYMRNATPAASSVRTGNTGFVYMPSVRMNRKDESRSGAARQMGERS